MSHILLVEDNSRDATLIKEAFKEALVDRVVEVVTDGEAALQVLYSAEFKPNLILLDLNLPKKSGLEVLKEIKRDPSLRAIPIIVLTNSRSEDDVVLAYASHCNAYVRKPLGYDRLLETLGSLGKFWLEVVTLPRQGSIDVSIPPSSGED
jgi:CheY-like chemotaxis protein